MKPKTKKNLMTKKGELNQNIVNALKNCRFDFSTNRIYTGYYTGSGRFASKANSVHTVELIVRSQGYKYDVLNDAPRGGILGEYVQLFSKTSINFIHSLIN